MSKILKVLDQLILNTRLEDIRMIASMPSDERLQRLAVGLSKLPQGYYLIGCGPYNTGIIKLGYSEIALGRQPSPTEEMSEDIVDYLVNDAVYLTPREVSRNHASIRVDKNDGKIYVHDNGSSVGTWVDGQQLDSVGIDVEIESGSVIMLGASGINVYLCLAISKDTECD